MSFFDRLKYVEGARPGINIKRKAPKTASKTEKDAEYDKVKRSRSFQEHWKNGRPWLEYEETEGKMSCSYCREHWGEKLDSLNVQAKLWISGTSNFKVDSLKTHEGSKFHVDSSKAAQTKNSNQPSPASVAIRQLNATQLYKLNIRFRNVHAVSKLDKSFKDYVWLCKLDKAKGLDIGNTYENDKAGRTFARYIAKVESDKTVQILNYADFCSISIDGATDSGGMEQESLYVHTCVDGVKQQRFLQFLNPKSTSSQDIYQSIIDCLEEFKINPKKVIGITTDGASNMMGIRNGVCTLMKTISPDIIPIHCLAHRLELGIKDAVKHTMSKSYDRAMTMLIGLYYFYSKSPKQKKELKSMFEVLDMTCSIPTRVDGTRWVPHTVKAINIFRRSYAAITSQLDNASHKNPKAEGLAKLAHDANVVAYLLMLKDILAPVTKLSLYLQREDTTLGDALVMVDST
ncbi:zinc finger protein 862-like [Saccostrea cucullata]|uniref:zinc finger protein 862-like n=1 Tax=Saccostrea cuccullata TaxID=36930 RepID=UPI002ED6183B